MGKSHAGRCIVGRIFGRTALVLAIVSVSWSARPALSCETCALPGGALPPVTPVCQVLSGTTTAACDTHVYLVNLIAGAQYVFTTCPAVCPGAAASYNARLRVYDPTCTLRADNDDTCGTSPQITFDALVDGQHRVEVTGSMPGDVGGYFLGFYRSDCGSSDCMTPAAVLAGPPVNTCNLVSETTECGDTQAWQIDLVARQEYTFTLCPLTCAGASAPFDSAIEIYDDMGMLVSNDSAGCGDDGEVAFTPGNAGTYCVLVRREGGTAGPFTLAYGVTCQPPSDIQVTPPIVGMTAADCSQEFTFTTTLAGTPNLDLDWEVLPPAGGMAMPAGGSIDNVPNVSNFATTLTGPGSYDIRITVVNDCGFTVEMFTIEVEDRRAPDLVLTAQATNCTGPSPRPIGGDEPPVFGPGVQRSHAVMGAAVPAGERSSSAPGEGTAAGGSIAGPVSDPLEPDSIDDTLDAGQRRWEAAQRKAELYANDNVVLDASRIPDLQRPPEADALGCATPCTAGTVQAIHRYYDVALDCNTGAFTARTGAGHSVTRSFGAMQNVIFGGTALNTGTSDITFHIHETGTNLLDPTGGSACMFDPPDTPSEPQNIGVEAEWSVTPTPGMNLTLRKEIVAFGTSDMNSGIRMTLGATNEATSTMDATVGVRWQIDYQHSSDDGPLFATVSCDPLGVVDSYAREHLLRPDELQDFYRIQNNTGTPIFSNFNSSAALAGFPGTAMPDRLIFGTWPNLNSSAWGYLSDEGNAAVDSDSAVLVYYGFRAPDAPTLAPGESFVRSIVLFTSGDDVDCGGFVPGSGFDTSAEVCPGGCLRLGAEPTDACGTSTAMVVGSSPGAPPCVGLPCDVQFDTPGMYTYTWVATDEAGNTTMAVTSVTVNDAVDCCEPSVSGPPVDTTICEGGSAFLNAAGLTLDNCTGTNYEWRDEGGMVMGTAALFLAQPMTTTTYTVTATCAEDAACFIEHQVTVTVESTPVIGTIDAVDISACNAGIALSWPAATFNDPTGTGVYNVYRSDISCADAVNSPPIAVGLIDTRYFDRDALSGVPQYYVVEAEDARMGTACIPAGPNNGGAVARSCTMMIADAATDFFMPPDGVDATLRVAHDGDEVTVSWAASRPLLADEDFHLLKAWTSPLHEFVQVNPRPDRGMQYVETDTSAPIQFFDLRVEDACGLISLDEFPPGLD